MVSLCHGMIRMSETNSGNIYKHNEIIGIDSQMIAKAKIRILLYKDFVVSHSVSLEDKQCI